ncbi:hypothetical protein [Halosimplex carlsbadense]|nr:hypothetical protein [Halosimplex carlsbadense]
MADEQASLDRFVTDGGDTTNDTNTDATDGGDADGDAVERTANATDITMPAAFEELTYEVEEWEKSHSTWRTDYGTTDEITGFPTDVGGEREIAHKVIHRSDAVPMTYRSTGRREGTHGVDVDELEGVGVRDGDCVTAARVLAALEDDDCREIVDAFEERVEEWRERKAAEERFSVRIKKMWTEGSGDGGTGKATFALTDAETGREYELIALNHVDMGCVIEGKGNREYDLPDAAVTYIRKYSGVPTGHLQTLADWPGHDGGSRGAPRHPRGRGGY